MDQWILDYLMQRDNAGNEFPLPLLLDYISQFNGMIASRIIQDKILWLETQKKMAPPLPFCWISMGSDARGEQVVRTDQDNALIYADPMAGQKEAAQTYFKALAHEVTHGLDQFGFTLCQGDVMATNPDWCRPLSQWLSALDDWVGSTDSNAVAMRRFTACSRSNYGAMYDERWCAYVHRN